MQHEAGKFWRRAFFEPAAPAAPEPPGTDPFCNTILRAVYKMAGSKIHDRITNKAANNVCYMLSRHGGGVARHPQSWHVVMSALQAGDSQQYERHCCPHCGRIWKWCHKDHWARRRRDRCPFDGTPRFKNGGTGGKLEPTRRCWMRPLKEIITSFLRDPKIAAHLGEHRDWDDGATFWGNPYAHWLNEMCKGYLKDPRDGEIAMLFALGT